MVCLARLMSTIYPGFVFRVFHLLLGRLPSKADEFYLPKATGLKAPDIRLSPVVCLQKQSLPRVGHTSDLSVRKLYVARAAWSISWKCKAYLCSSPRHDRPFKDHQSRSELSMQHMFWMGARKRFRTLKCRSVSEK